MKYYVLLAANCLLLWMLVMFFIDNQWLPEGILPKARNFVLVVVFLTVGYNLVTIYVLKNAAPESALLYRTFTAAKIFASRCSSYSQPIRKELFIYSLIAAALIVIGLLLLGMPGALMLQVPAKLGWGKSITGDAAWPAAILLSTLWPLCLPVTVLLKGWLSNNGYITVAAMPTVYSLLPGIPLLTLLVYALYR